MTAEDLDTPSDVFLDTCILLNYVHAEWEREKSVTFLERHPAEKRISEKVEDEFDSACNRRQDIYPDILEFLNSNEELIEDYDVNERSLDITGNDWTHVQTIQMRLAQLGEASEVKWQLRRYLKRMRAKIEYIKSDLISQNIVPRNFDLDLEFALNHSISNTNDCNVVCDAAAWSREGGSGVLVTLDKADLLGDADHGTESLPDKINKTIQEHYSEAATLQFKDPREFEAELEST